MGACGTQIQTMQWDEHCWRYAGEPHEATETSARLQVHTLRSGHQRSAKQQDDPLLLHLQTTVQEYSWMNKQWNISRAAQNVSSLSILEKAA